jgi:DNA-binding NtrC family response regulator
VQLFAAEMGIEPPAFAPGVIEWLDTYDFPGNVRELKNIIERALIESGGTEIQPQHLHGYQPPHAVSTGNISAGPSLADLPLNFAEAEVVLVKRAMERAQGNVSQAARLLGIDRNKIYRILAREKDPENTGTL